MQEHHPRSRIMPLRTAVAMVAMASIEEELFKGDKGRVVHTTTGDSTPYQLHVHPPSDPHDEEHRSFYRAERQREKRYNWFKQKKAKSCQRK